MVKLSVSQAARRLGVKRQEIQEQINSGKLQTHEGYVTTDSLRLAYPQNTLQSEQDRRLIKLQQIKDDAIYKSGASDSIHDENEQALMATIAALKTKLYKEKLKNEHYGFVFEELSERLSTLEQHCHAKDKESLHQLQKWVGPQH